MLNSAALCDVATIYAKIASNIREEIVFNTLL